MGSFTGPASRAFWSRTCLFTIDRTELVKKSKQVNPISALEPCSRAKATRWLSMAGLTKPRQTRSRSPAAGCSSRILRAMAASQRKKGSITANGPKRRRQGPGAAAPTPCVSGTERNYQSQCISQAMLDEFPPIAELEPTQAKK